MEAKYNLTKKGFANHPGWHVMATQSAPHLGTRGRVWAKVEFEDYQEFTRPTNQGGKWFLARRMRVLELLPNPPAFDREAWIDGSPALRGYL